LIIFMISIAAIAFLSLLLISCRDIGEEMTEEAVDKEMMIDGYMEKYECEVCGYIYNPEAGDTEKGIKPGTAFEDLPDDWVCPKCGASKDEFEVVK